MALTWNDRTRRAQSGQAASESYQAEVPHWGEASVHTHIHHPGEVFLECHAQGIEMHPLGRVESMDALNPAEMVLLRTLREHAVWCLDAMAAIGSNISNISNISNNRFIYRQISL